MAAHQRKAYSEPRNGTLRRRLRLNEHVEHPWQNLGGDTNSSIADADDFHVVCMLQGKSDVRMNSACVPHVTTA